MTSGKPKPKADLETQEPGAKPHAVRLEAQGKSEGKSEVKSEKAHSKSEAKAGAKSATKPESKAESKSGAKAEDKAEPTTPDKPAVKSESKSRTGSLAKLASLPEPSPLTHPEIKTIVLGIMLAMFLGALDQTIVATALPTIGRHFGNINDLSWVVTAYLLNGTAVTPLYGKLADTYGRRILMLTAVGIFVLGSIACALAPSMTALVLARGCQG